MAGAERESMTEAVASPKATGTAVGRGQESTMIRLLRRWGTIVVVLLTAIGFAIASPYFATVSNANNILFSMIVSALVSMGLTWVVVAGSFDLSVGLTVTTTSIIVAFLIPVVGPWVAIILSLVVACFI